MAKGGGFDEFATGAAGKDIHCWLRDELSALPERNKNNLPYEAPSMQQGYWLLRITMIDSVFAPIPQRWSRLSTGASKSNEYLSLLSQAILFLSLKCFTQDGGESRSTVPRCWDKCHVLLWNEELFLLCTKSRLHRAERVRVNSSSPVLILLSTSVLARRMPLKGAQRGGCEPPNGSATGA